MIPHQKLDRFAVAVLQGVTQRLWGFPPHLMPVLVAQLGGRRAIAWFLWKMPRYQRTLTVFGRLRTHLLGITISLINSCAYCTFGTAYALQLIYLKEHDTLFPLDEHAITVLHLHERAETRERLVAALHEADLSAEVPWVDRLIALASHDRQPADHDDTRITHLIGMFAVLNTCAIAGDVAPDEAHDTINKDQALKERYALLRAESST